MGNSGPARSSDEAPDEGAPDGRDRAAGERERDLDDREARADRRDAARTASRLDHQAVLDAADLRDERADSRDSLADDRDAKADRNAFLTSPGYGEDLPARRHAAVDRSSSRDDRRAAASDRSKLAATDEGDEGDEGEDPSGR